MLYALGDMHEYTLYRILCSRLFQWETMARLVFSLLLAQFVNNVF